VHLDARGGWNLGNGTDDYGFRALPAGQLAVQWGAFGASGDLGIWWTSSAKAIGPLAWSVSWGQYGSTRVQLDKMPPYYYVYGQSVRCLRDQDAY
jgi:uncharacterized protein (TIGR02145 family)